MISKIAYISPESDKTLRSYLRSLGYNIKVIFSDGIVDDPLSGHPDIFMCKLGLSDDAEIIHAADDSESILGKSYPHDVPYNAACTGEYFIHNLKYTAPRLLVRAEELGMTLVDVKQGYSKCSTVVVDEYSIITYDDGIAAACMRQGLDVLQIAAGHVALQGYNTGFIGGASGRVGDTIVFNGDLSRHPDFVRIVDFINEKSLDTLYFEQWPLTDIGSIITTNVY